MRYSLYGKDQSIRVIELTERLTPMLDLDFDQNSDGIVLTPIKVYEVDVNGRPIIIDSNGSYVRIRLSARSEVPVRACSAFITRIEKRVDGNFSRIRMPNH